MRVGIGYDIHRFLEGRPFVLGGIKIPHPTGLEGHSDGDALIHAICDAILGAGGMDDIGNQFPVDDKRYEGVASTELLKHVRDIIREKGFKVDYIDSVVIVEEPKLAPFKESMKKKIASSLGIEIANINIKATSQEGVGAIGRGEAVSAYAVVCVTGLSSEGRL